MHSQVLWHPLAPSGTFWHPSCLRSTPRYLRPPSHPHTPTVSPPTFIPRFALPLPSSRHPQAFPGTPAPSSTPPTIILRPRYPVCPLCAPSVPPLPSFHPHAPSAFLTPFGYLLLPLFYPRARLCLYSGTFWHPLAPSGTLWHPLTPSGTPIAFVLPPANSAHLRTPTRPLSPLLPSFHVSRSLCHHPDTPCHHPDTPRHSQAPLRPLAPLLPSFYVHTTLSAPSVSPPVSPLPSFHPHAPSAFLSLRSTPALRSVSPSYLPSTPALPLSPSHPLAPLPAFVLPRAPSFSPFCLRSTTRSLTVWYPPPAFVLLPHSLCLPHTFWHPFLPSFYPALPLSLPSAFVPPPRSLFLPVLPSFHPRAPSFSPFCLRSTPTLSFSLPSAFVPPPRSLSPPHSTDNPSTPATLNAHLHPNPAIRDP
ncbi:hypothetical protein F5887DRAFT_1084541 [Amanita rubescens]|nr:hypothetical protein F5887DRAFT_1084541 [Amanita rubescens]